jgi:hypothetical protein
MLISQIRRAVNAEKEANHTRKGFYLVLPSGARHFISESVNPSALERLCDKHLTEATGWEYWIDYSLGVDVEGNPAWVNLNLSYRFL